ncbi:Endoribonuclease MazF [termite gut metagenome]|uniref:Endoribonuclease MazF n=1 Tax=termite gut metagenome TaxID=433724 RepID=A0A5J4T1K9_9ZZZZ
MADVGIIQYGVYWVHFNLPTSSETAKTKPCVIVSPDELNKHLNTVIIIPITSIINNYRYRVQCCVDSRTGEIATDRIKSLDKSRIKKFIGKLSDAEIEQLKSVLLDMFR